MAMTQEQRIRELARPGNFEVEVRLDEHIASLLSSHERIRLYQKLTMIENIARKQAAAMLKGTIKYTQDESERSLRSWLEHTQSELIDATHYTQFALDQLDRSEQDGV